MRYVDLPPWVEWKVQRKSFKSLGVQMGRDVDAEKVWEDMKRKVRNRMNQILMSDLPLTTRCSIINRYCYSKILYLDKFLPAPSSATEDVEKAAISRIWKRDRPSVNPQRLTTIQDMGGFGLMPLMEVLQVSRAQWVMRLVAGDFANTPYLLVLRQSIAIHYVINRKRFPKLLNKGNYFYWFEHNFFSPFCSLDGCNHQYLDISYYHLLPKRWRNYLAAWNHSVTLAPLVKKHRPSRVLHQQWVKKSLKPLPLAWFRNCQGKSLTEEWLSQGKEVW